MSSKSNTGKRRSERIKGKSTLEKINEDESVRTLQIFIISYMSTFFKIVKLFIQDAHDEPEFVRESHKRKRKNVTNGSLEGGTLV
jgi:hypothetical protein